MAGTDHGPSNPRTTTTMPRTVTPPAPDCATGTGAGTMAADATSRRAFLRAGGSCMAWLFGLHAAAPERWRRVFAQERGTVVAREPWGRIEQVADGVWAMISTPLEDRTTLCNGGIVRGRAGVLIIESFARPEGAAWLAQQARALTGRGPDQIVLTHYHGDHTAGVAGYAGAGSDPRVYVTDRTRALVREQDGRRPEPPASERTRLLDAARLLDPGQPTRIDLGDRVVTVVPRTGHTASDVTIEIEEPAVVFCGDLVWNQMFPNYVDAVPSRLSQAVRALVRDAGTVWVPGHGPLADAAALQSFIGLLDDVEAAARRAHEAGTNAQDAAAAYRLPPALAEWTLFNPRYFEIAIGAWLRELQGAPTAGGHPHRHVG